MARPSYELYKEEEEERRMNSMLSTGQQRAVTAGGLDWSSMIHRNQWRLTGLALQ